MMCFFYPSPAGRYLLWLCLISFLLEKAAADGTAEGKTGSFEAGEEASGQRSPNQGVHTAAASQDTTESEAVEDSSFASSFTPPDAFVPDNEAASGSFGRMRASAEQQQQHFASPEEIWDDVRRRKTRSAFEKERTVTQNGVGEEEEEETSRRAPSDTQSKAETQHKEGRPDFDDDDRTLLDLFGQVAKEYLTQKLIRETDAECRWDWRSIRCEPASYCSFQFLSGDYHLGRSCRRKRRQGGGGAGEGGDCCSGDGKCGRSVPDDATLFVREQLPTRLASLVRQTADIVAEESRKAVRGLRQATSAQVSAVRSAACHNFWDNVSLLRQQQVIRSGRSPPCWPLGSVPVPNLADRILCGPVEFPVCEEETDEETNGGGRESIPPMSR
jgi:hypothetical protein